MKLYKKAVVSLWNNCFFMHIYVRKPELPELKRTLKIERSLPYSYKEIGAVTSEIYPSGYDHDLNRCLIGEGPKVFADAKHFIQGYRHFPAGWTFVFSDGKIPETDLTLTTTFQQFGLWWINGLRVVDVIDEPSFYGFSYGTLTSHIERGEELFYTEMMPDGKVYYGIKAFSEPRFWGARLIKPYARGQQRRFVLESMQQMQNLTMKIAQHA